MKEWNHARGDRTNNVPCKEKWVPVGGTCGVCGRVRLPVTGEGYEEGV